MAGRALVTVGGYSFPEPSTYNSNTSTLVDSARNAAGVLIGSVIRDEVSKVEITWSYLTVADWARIQRCFRQSSGGGFSNLVTFFDQSAGGWVTKEMYVSDRKAGMWRRDPKNGDILGWTNCSLNLIEV